MHQQQWYRNSQGWVGGPLDNTDYVRDLDFRSEPVPDHLSCLARSLTACGRQFQGPSFQHCVLGLAVVNNLLPPSTTSALFSIPTDVQGAYQVGLSMVCIDRELIDGYPAMIF